MASWLAQFTKGSSSNNNGSALSPPSSSSSTTSRTSSTSQRKKSRLSDAMDTTSSNNDASSLDEGGFYWVPATGNNDSGASSTVVDTAAGHALYPRLNARTTSTTTSTTSAPSARGGPTAMDEEEPLPPYRRPVSGVATHDFSSSSSSAAAAAVSGRVPTLGRTPAYAPLQLSSFRINPHLAAIATPPPNARSTAELVDKMRVMETKLKQGPSYDPCFEVEIAAQAKLDRQKQDMQAKELEERYRKYRAVVEAEAKRQQDIAITEWVEQHQQQQRQQKQHDDDAALSATTSSSVMSGVDQTLLDLSFPSNRRLLNQLPVASQPPSDSSTELPPPYPGPLRAADGQKQHSPPGTTAPLHFPAPMGQPAPGMAAGGGSFARPPAYYHAGASFASSAAYPPYTVAGSQPPATIAFPLPPQQAVPSSALFAQSASPSPSGASFASTSVPVNSALLMPPPRTTLEEYQRKYPVLANPERRAMFIQLLEMQFKPEIVALGLEVYPDNQLEKIVTFVANSHKLIEMGYAPERVKQALLLHDDGNVQKAITYLEELDNLIKAGLKESEIFDAFLLFDNDIQKASSFLLAHKALAQFGFDDIRIREALLMCDNSQEKAAQYLLMNT